MTLTEEIRIADDAGTRVGWRGWAALIVLMLPVLLVSVDNTVLSFAIPAIAEDLAPSSAQQLWIVDAYPLVLAGLLVTMGTFGDRFGRRRMLLIGATGFAVVSVLAAFAPTAAALIVARAAMGVFGAMLMPSTLSLLRSIFTDRNQRRLAIAVWASMFSAGSAIGPVVGGFLLEHFAWGSVFLLSVPVLVPLLVFGLWGGSLADHMDRRRLLTITTWGLILSSAALWVQAALGSTNVWLLLSIYALQQAFFAVNQPTRGAAIARIVPAGTTGAYDRSVLVEDTEKALADRVDALPDHAGDGLVDWLADAKAIVDPANTFFDEILVMADDAHLSFPFVRLGIVPDGGSSYFLQAKLGVAIAQDLLLTAGKLDAAEAGRLGLTRRIVPAGELRASAHALAEELARLPREARMLTKSLCRQFWARGLEAYLAHEADAFAFAASTPGHRKALEQIKRAPPGA